MRSNKKIIILFPDVWLPYSPSILNLVSLLQLDGFDCTIITFDNGKFFNQFDYSGIKVKVLKINDLFYRLFSKLHLINLIKLCYFFLQITLTNKKNTRLIGVDTLGALAARFFDKSSFYLSLEVGHDFYSSLLKKLGVSNLVIQTPERAKYQFEGLNVQKIFYLQNSPIIEIKSKVKTKPLGPLKFVYFGNISKSHGVEICIHSVLNYDSTSTIYLNGPIRDVYRVELENIFRKHLNSRIFLSSSYVPQEEVITFLSGFDMGFVFYDFELIDRGDFNYTSCPSGKLFNYYAAALPVLGSDILGLRSVKSFEAGILLKELNEKTIIQAVGEVLSRYEACSAGSLKAADHFDFSQGYEKIKTEL